MPLLRFSVVAVFAAFIFAPAFAGENTNKQLHQRIQELKTELVSLKEIARLKREIAKVKKQLSGPEKIPQKVRTKTNAAAGKKVVDTPRPTPKLKPVDAFKALRKLEQSALPSPKPKSVDAFKALRKLEQSALPTPKLKSDYVFKALRKLEQSALPSPKLKPVKLVPKPLAIEPKAKKFRTAVLGKTHTVTNRFSKQTSIKQRVAHSSFKKLKDDKKRWNVSMRALYLRQIDDTLVLENQSPDDNDPTGINDLDAQYGSGIEGQIAYRFPNSKWSASATGRYFSEETRRIFQPLKTKNIVIGAGKLVRGVEPLFATPPGTEDLVERFNSVVTADFDARYSLGGPINSQIIAGLRVGHLDRTLNLYTAGIHSPGPPFNFQATTTENRSQFTGIGPRLGISTNIPIYGGFALQGKLGASILPGFSEVKSLNRNADASGGIGGNFPEEFEVHKTDFKVVPVFDGDLAIQYKHTFGGMDAFASLGFTTQHWLGVRDFFRTTNPTDDPRRRLKDTVVGFFGPSFKVRVAW